jgi:hypothetical protein
MRSTSASTPYIRLDGDGLAPGRAHLSGQRVGRIGRSGIVDGHVMTIACQQPHAGRTYAPAGACNQHRSLVCHCLSPATGSCICQLHTYQQIACVSTTIGHEVAFEDAALSSTGDFIE